ncbi:uncharacterized protein LOC117784746 [Drosophila innubila]|uniref:uncharacterized protein LOC117784746 n=1 Tax=Drosophila innubila TaxID=198719 RepID=UPI00148BB054|nr:uncharacterized protein LOC117784746 [Drosophila innubila]
MTVKLAKLFGRSSSSKSNSNSAGNETDSVVGNSFHHGHSGHNLQQQPPPPNANMKLIKYYDHHLDQPTTAMTIYGHSYGCSNDELVDDYDDNTLLNSRCMQRNHPYNNSQRPLLGDCRPQLMLVMAGGKNKQSTTTTSATPMAGIPPPAPPLPPQRNVTDATGSAYVSPYVQQQKRDSVKGLHGFNDFDALSQQYNQHLQGAHIGYPYGSPPSPTVQVQSSDFCFDSRQQERKQSLKAISSSTSSTATTKSNCSSNSAANGSPPPRYGNVSYQNADYYLEQQLTQSQSHTHCLPHSSSRFEDDFCTRRNVNFVGSQAGTVPTVSSTGPFIFGISHEEQQTVYGLRRHCSISSVNSTTNNIKNILNQTVINVTPIKEHKALQKSLSDTSADSGKGGKFLLRKHKSRKTAATAAAEGVSNAVANGEHKKKQGSPSIKCVLVGDGAVGKTNLILSYLENRFNPQHVPTASDIYNADVNVNDNPVHLTLCDTAGQDTLDPLRELCYPDSDVFLLCFSVVKPESFESIKSKWAPKFTKTKVALILVGTQADLRSNSNMLNKLQTNGEKPISYADAWDLATNIGAKYIETSSATQDKVKDVFDAAIWEGLVPTILPPTPSFWRKLFCLA